MIRAIFLDFDGTVSDAKGIAYESMVRTLGEFGYDFDNGKLLRLMGTKMRFILAELGIKSYDLEKVRKRFYKHFTGAALDGEIKPCVPLKPLWDISKDYPLIIVSNSELSFLKASIKVLKLKGLFKGAYGVERKCSKDEILVRLFKKMKIKPEEAMYIGDRFSDVDFARSCGCVAVAIHNKCAWSTLAQMKKEKPDYIIKDFYDLKKILKKLDKVEK